MLVLLDSPDKINPFFPSLWEKDEFLVKKSEIVSLLCFVLQITLHFITGL